MDHILIIYCDLFDKKKKDINSLYQFQLQMTSDGLIDFCNPNCKVLGDEICDKLGDK